MYNSSSLSKKGGTPMRKTLALSLSLVLLLCLALCGCSSTADKDELKYNTAYPLGAAEYQMAVNHKLAPLISELQPLANAEAVSRDEAEHAVNSINDVYSDIAAMNPPKDKVIYQTDLLAELQAASDWLKAQYDDTVTAPAREFSDILRMIENAFSVSVN